MQAIEVRDIANWNRVEALVAMIDGTSDEAHDYVFDNFCPTCGHSYAQDVHQICFE